MYPLSPYNQFHIFLSIQFSREGAIQPIKLNCKEKINLFHQLFGSFHLDYQVRELLPSNKKCDWQFKSLLFLSWLTDIFTILFLLNLTKSSPPFNIQKKLKH